MIKHHKTSERSPRANSTFQTSETRELYRMAEEIMDILQREKPRRYVAAGRIANVGHSLGYCRPVVDEERLAHSHPYWRVLSGMTDIHSPLFKNNLEEIDDQGVLRYRLRSDVVRSSKNGNWKKVKGCTEFYGIPVNRMKSDK